MKNEEKLDILKNIKGAKTLTVLEQKDVKGGAPRLRPVCNPILTCCYKKNGVWVPGPPCA